MKIGEKTDMTAMDTAELKKRFRKLGVKCFELSALVCTITYLLFHYVTCDGITLEKQKEAGKPFLTYLFGSLGVRLFSAGVMYGLFPKTVIEQGE